MKKKSLAYYIFIIILGGIIGSVLGDFLAKVLPPGVVKQFFLNSVPFGIDPTTINLSIVEVTFGFSMTFNIIGVVGILLLAYFLRWME